MINIDDLQRELTQLTEEELQIENELSTYIQALVGDRTKSGSSSALKKATATSSFGSGVPICAVVLSITVLLSSILYRTKYK